MTDISLIFSIATMYLGAGGLLLVYRLTKWRPKWIDGMIEEKIGEKRGRLPR